jgi:hypothetical protein
VDNNNSGVGVLDKAVAILTTLESGPHSLAELVAATVTEYSVPGESPETVTDDPIAEESGDAAAIEPEETGEIVTVYDSIVAPPLNVAAPIVTFAVVADAAVALTDAGAPGTVG